MNEEKLQQSPRHSPHQAPGDRRLASAVLIAFVVVAAISTVTALVVAIGGFTWGLPDDTHIQSYHPDEANVTRSLQAMRPRNLDFNPHFFGNPTFFTYQIGALALGASATGFLPAESTKEFWISHPQAVRRFYILGRGLSFCYAVFSAVLLYIVALETTTSRRAALLATALYVSLPAFAIHSHYMTVTASAVFWSLLALYFALRLRRLGSWKNYILAGLFAGLAVSTKLNNAFLPLAIIVASLQAGKIHNWKEVFFSPRLWVSLLVCAGAFAAASPYYVLSRGSVQSDWHNQENMRALFDFSTPAALLLKDFWNNLSGGCGHILAAVFLISVPAAFLVDRKRLAPFLAVALPFLAIAAKSGYWAFPSRMLPLLAILSILTAVLCCAQYRRRPARWVLAAVVLAGLLATVPWNVAYLNLMSGGHVRRESSLWIEEHIPFGSSIIVLDTPYFEVPDIVYENALHPDHTPWPKYKIVNLKGDYDALGAARGDWLVVPERFDRKLRAAEGAGVRQFAEAHGFGLAKEFSRKFEAFGFTLRDWVPTDMVQNYPVFLFRRKAPLAAKTPGNPRP